MRPNDEQNRSRFVPVKMLPEMAFEMPIEPSTHYGKAEAPVTILPATMIDLTDQATQPAIQITFQLREKAAAAEVALDLVRVYSAINQLELSYGGSGLAADQELSEAVPSEGKVRVTFRPIEERGAADRVKRLVSAINEPSNDIPSKPGSIVRCEAIQLPAA